MKPSIPSATVNRILTRIDRLDIPRIALIPMYWTHLPSIAGEKTAGTIDRRAMGSPAVIETHQLHHNQRVRRAFCLLSTRRETCPGALRFG